MHFKVNLTTKNLTKLAKFFVSFRDFFRFQFFKLHRLRNSKCW